MLLSCINRVIRKHLGPSVLVAKSAAATMEVSEVRVESDRKEIDTGYT